MTIWHGQSVPNRHDADTPCFMALSHYRDQKALYFSSETHCSILQHPLGGGGGAEGTTGHLAAGRGHASLRKNKKTLFASPLFESRRRRRVFRSRTANARPSTRGPRSAG
jgi:hypothetical protein